MNVKGGYDCFLSGDEDALGELVIKYNKKLVLYLTGMLKSVSLAEDAAADAFVEILVKKPRLKTESEFCAYLYRSARNNAIDELRRRKRINESCIEEKDYASDKQSLENTVLSNERERQLYKALSLIKDEYREALSLVYLWDMSYEAAGKIMKKSAKQINNLVYRGKQALKVILEKEGCGYEVG